MIDFRYTLNSLRLNLIDAETANAEIADARDICPKNTSFGNACTRDIHSKTACIGGIFVRNAYVRDFFIRDAYVRNTFIRLACSSIGTINRLGINLELSRILKVSSFNIG